MLGSTSPDSEWERLQSWAREVRPSDYTLIDVKGLGLAGFQYLRMLFGVQTTKPDRHILAFVSETVGRAVDPPSPVTLLEEAAKRAGILLREADGALWAERARPATVSAGAPLEADGLETPPQYGHGLRKVVLEYDGQIRVLEGIDAERWMDAINQRILFLTKHAGFGEFPQFEWSVKERERGQQ